jgi:hypothetical protein
MSSQLLDDRAMPKLGMVPTFFIPLCRRRRLRDDERDRQMAGQQWRQIWGCVS